MMSAKSEVDALGEPQFADIPYDLVADEKVAQLMASGEVAKVLQEYVEQYNKLLAQSKFFKKGTFNQYNAATIAKALGNNGFFDARHTVVLVGDKRVEVKNQKELEQVIAKEKEAIMKDTKLRERFDKMDKLITKNEQLRDLQAFLSENEEVLALMADMEKLKRTVLLGYFKANESDFNQVVKTYQLALTRSKEIEAQAAKQRTQWEGVIEIFNRRFFVPFELTAKIHVQRQRQIRTGRDRTGRLDRGVEHRRKKGSLHPERHFRGRGTTPEQAAHGLRCRRHRRLVRLQEQVRDHSVSQGHCGGGPFQAVDPYAQF
jgi:hypothetical protein